MALCGLWCGVCSGFVVGGKLRWWGAFKRGDIGKMLILAAVLRIIPKNRVVCASRYS